MAVKQQPKTFGQAIDAFTDTGRKTETATVCSVGDNRVYVQTASGSILPAACGVSGLKVGDSVTLQDDRGRLSVVAGGGAGGAVSGGVSFAGATSVTYSGAPSTASYLTLGSDSSLANERVFVAGNGLTETDGGAGSTYTVDVGAGTGITVSAGNVAVTTNYNFVWTATHDFQNGLYIGSDVWLSRLGANILGLGTGDTFQSQGFTSGVNGWQIKADGTAEFENVRVRGELSASVFTVNEISATAGTQIVAYSAGVLWEDFTTPSAISGTGTLKVKNTDDSLSLFSNGSRLQMKRLGTGGVANSWLEVTGSPTNNTTYTSYPVTLRSGTTSSPFSAGNAIVDWGPSGSGAISLSADGAIGSSANMSIMTHAGSPWSTTTLVTRLGNMNGSYGVASNYYGIGLGDYSGGNYLKYDTNGGFVMAAGTESVYLDTDGMRMKIPASTSISYADQSAIGWSTTPDTAGGLLAYVSAARSTGGVWPANALRVFAQDTGAARQALVEISATNTTTGTGPTIFVSAKGDGVDDVTAVADTITLTGAVTATSVNVGSATGATSGQVRAHELYLGTGSDVRLYRSAADTLRTPDYVTIDSGLNMGTATGAGAGDIAVQTRLRFTSADADGGSYALIGLDAGSTKDIEVYDYFNSRAMFRVFGSTRNTQTFGSAIVDGSVGIGTASPQGPLHVYESGTGSGYRHYSYTSLDATRRTVVANGTGDCTKGVRVAGMATTAAGVTANLDGFVDFNSGSEQSTIIVNISGVDQVSLYVKTDGAIEIARSAGSQTWTVSMGVWWA